MRYIFSRVFWVDMDTRLWKAAVSCLSLTIIWALISGGLYFFEGNRSYFEINTVLQFKIIFAAVIFLGRYLLFAKHRQYKWFKWILIVAVLITVGSQGDHLIKTPLNLIYFLLKVCDSLVWGIFITVLLETLGALFLFWNHISKVPVSQLEQLWRLAWQEIIALGILLTLLAGLIYYYLTSFYLVDTIFYSYILLIPVSAAGLRLYLTIRIRINNWLRQDLSSLDQEIDTCLQWQHFKTEPEFYQKLCWLEYLTLIRSHLVQTSRLRVSWKTLGCYLTFSVLIIILPYLFGLAIEVGSFK
jgi:hypothetical protein